MHVRHTFSSSKPKWSPCLWCCPSPHVLFLYNLWFCDPLFRSGNTSPHLSSPSWSWQKLTLTFLPSSYFPKVLLSLHKYRNVSMTWTIIKSSFSLTPCEVFVIHLKTRLWSSIRCKLLSKVLAHTTSARYGTLFLLQPRSCCLDFCSPQSTLVVKPLPLVELIYSARTEPVTGFLVAPQKLGEN